MLVLVIAILWIPFAPWVAERLLFFPDSSDPGPAPVISGVSGKDVRLQASDGVEVHGWWHPVSAGSPTVLLLHGNAGNIAGRTPIADGYLSRGISVFMLDYRGYGRSAGAPTERGLYRDAHAALDFLEGVAGLEHVTVHGRSLGAAVAAPTAGTRDVAGVILESAFTSLADVSRAVYPFLPSLLVRPLSGRFDTRTAVAGIEAPVLIVHGAADELIPIWMGMAVYDAAREPRTWYPLEGARHNDALIVGGEAYFDRLAAFVREADRSAGNRGRDR